MSPISSLATYWRPQRPGAFPLLCFPRRLTKVPGQLSFLRPQRSKFNLAASLIFLLVLFSHRDTTLAGAFSLPSQLHPE